MLRAGVIDDEPRSLADLVRRLEETGLFEVTCQTTDPAAGLQLLHQTTPDVVFLDIEMPGLDGLALAAALPASTAVVFVSAYSTHALAAFDLAAIDFLLKPVDDNRFRRMIDRVQRQLSPSDGQDAAPGALLVLETRRGRVFCPEPEILGVFAEGDMSRVLMRGDRQVYCLRGLKHFEQTLDNERFARIDRSTLINLDAVRALKPMSGAKTEVALSDSALPLTFGRAAASRLRRCLADRAT